MHPTKSRILQAGVSLFNQAGFANISLGRIASELDMSKGNLAYHYPNVAAILEAIYPVMKAEMEAVFVQQGRGGLLQLDRSLRYFYDFQQRYRFFFLDLVEIARRVPGIASRHQQLVRQRQAEGLRLLQHYVQNDLLLPPKQVASYRRLVHAIWIINTFWLSQQRLSGEKQTPPDPEKPLALVWQLIYPYLTPAGRSEFQANIPSYEKLTD